MLALAVTPALLHRPADEWKSERKHMTRKGKILLAGIGALAVVGIGAGLAIAQHQGRGDRSGLMGQGMMGMGGEDEPGMRGRRRFLVGPRELTQDEWDARTRERFARFDKNGDGVIDAAELESAFVAGMERRMGWRGRRGQGANPRQMFLQRFDENRDGKVTKDEFLGAVRRRFAELDLNNDGRITDDDLPPMMRGRGVLSGGGDGGPTMGRGGGRMAGGGMGLGMGGGGGLGFLRQADANKDGVVTLDEALAHAEKELARLDKNRDGTVDQADFDALRKENVDYMVKRFVHRFGSEADRAGRVSKDQFYARAKDMFARLDANKDGKLTGDELPGGRRWGRGGEERGGGRGMGRGRGPGPGDGDQPQRGGPGGPGGPGPGPGRQ
jgi:Ca2+-binding EF-hand superfamily protein